MLHSQPYHVCRKADAQASSGLVGAAPSLHHFMQCEHVSQLKMIVYARLSMGKLTWSSGPYVCAVLPIHKCLFGLLNAHFDPTLTSLCSESMCHSSK